MMFIAGRHLLERKGLKKVFISFCGDTLIIEGSPLPQEKSYICKNINDYKSFLINNGYKMNWWTVQNLLKYWG